MSSVPLISHHLFVAAVKGRDGEQRLPQAGQPAPVAPEVLVDKPPLAWAESDRSVPAEARWADITFDWEGPA